MTRAHNPNLTIVELAAHRLGPLIDEVVLLGGCATGLLLTDVAAPPIRATLDVDVITEVASLSAYHRLSERLRSLGFREDQSEGAPLCRWTADALILDVMPTHADVLGFGNPWYQPALDASTQFALPSGQRIRMVTAPYFLATKLAAFDDRGKGDYVMSHDLEDMVAVIDGRPELVEEVLNAEPELRNHLSARFSTLLEDSAFLAALPGHVLADAVSQARQPLILARIQKIATNLG
jgi:predicted nucleotidyltransferase